MNNNNIEFLKPEEDGQRPVTDFTHDTILVNLVRRSRLGWFCEARPVGGYAWHLCRLLRPASARGFFRFGHSCLLNQLLLEIHKSMNGVHRKRTKLHAGWLRTLVVYLEPASWGTASYPELRFAFAIVELSHFPLLLLIRLTLCLLIRAKAGEAINTSPWKSDISYGSILPPVFQNQTFTFDPERLTEST